MAGPASSAAHEPPRNTCDHSKIERARYVHLHNAYITYYKVLHYMGSKMQSSVVIITLSKNCARMRVKSWCAESSGGLLLSVAYAIE